MKDCPVSPGDILAEKYRVDRVLGCGGMGVVAAAWHMELEQLVAMKFLLPELAENKEAAERFRREARAAVRIKSEHVARVLDVGTMDGGVPFMVMEFMEGKDLGLVLDERGSLGILTAIDYVTQVCEAIAEAHSLGIVHRDLKPANLFLTRRSDGSSLVKVLDFGISKTVTGGSSDMALTRTSAIVGSPLYMSPEQLESAKNVDPRSDIWSLGVILYELISGSVPFQGDTIPQLVRAVLGGIRRPLNEVVPDVPEELEAIVASCLAHSPADRFDNVAQFVQALAEFGPQHCALSVERVSRLLDVALSERELPSRRVAGRTGPGQPVAGETRVSGDGDISIPNPTAQSAEGNTGNHTETLSNAISVHELQPLRPSGSTMASWGKTESGASNKGRTRIGIAAAAALVLGGLGAAWSTFGDSDESTTAAAAQSSTSLQPPNTEAPPTEPTQASPAGDLDAEPESSSGVQVSPVASASASADLNELDDDASSPGESAEIAATSDQAPKKAAPIKKARPKVSPPKPKPAATAPSGDGWTDFGGRR